VKDAFSELSRLVIGFAIEAHRELGTGMLEAAYEQCLCLELREHGIAFERQVVLPVTYKSATIENAFRIDVVVAGELAVEVKAVETLLPVHTAQLLPYLRFGRYQSGLLFNFHAYRLLDGMKRVVR
jgi:GxxExxY protein